MQSNAHGEGDHTSSQVHETGPVVSSSVRFRSQYVSTHLATRNTGFTFTSLRMVASGKHKTTLCPTVCVQHRTSLSSSIVYYILTGMSTTTTTRLSDNDDERISYCNLQVATSAAGVFVACVLVTLAPARSEMF